jgi:hypothetical protein
MNTAAMIPQPATRRIRRFGEDSSSGGSSLVYVGSNPVPKRTTKMLRKKHQQPTQTEKIIPKRASKTKLKQNLKSRNSSNNMSMTKISSNHSLAPRAPRRKPSNPYLVSPSGEATRALADDCSAHSPRFPRRKPSFPDLDSSEDGSFDDDDDEPFSNLFPPQPPSPAVTRSMSKAKLQQAAAAPKAPSRQLSIPDMEQQASIVVQPCNTSPSYEGCHVPTPQRLENPLIQTPPSPLQATMALEATLACQSMKFDVMDHSSSSSSSSNDPWSHVIMTRSQSKQRLAPRVPCRKASVDCLVLPSTNNHTIPMLFSPKRHSLQDHQKKVSFMDLEWNQMSFR